MKVKIRITKEFAFEMAHALKGYDGTCKHIHGHSYRLFVTVKGSPIESADNPKFGMVMDFGELKRIVNEVVIDKYDHALVLRADAANEDLITGIDSEFGKITKVDYQPTCENMIYRFADQIAQKLPENVELHHIKLHETATSFAEWYAEDNL